MAREGGFGRTPAAGSRAGRRRPRPRGGCFRFPLYVAAQAFELMLVRRRAGARSARASTIITLGAELYQRPWERRLAAARASGAAIGVKPWPKALA